MKLLGWPVPGPLAVALTVLSLLSGCSGSLFQSNAPVPQTYVLAPGGPGATGDPALSVDLSVAHPDTAPALNTDQILLLRDGHRVDHFSHVQWGAAAARVVQFFMIASLQNQNLFRSVTSDEARVSAPYVLGLELRDFQAEYTQPGAPPSVHVSLLASVLRVRDRGLLAVIPVGATVPAAADRMGAICDAFEAALRQVADELGPRLVKSIRESPAETREKRAPSLGAEARAQ